MTLNLEKPFHHHTERRQGRLDSYRIRDFSETSDYGLAMQARRIHGEGYVAEGFVKPSALDADGMLPADIDKARGDNVRYYLSTGWDVDQSSAFTIEGATMRKISIPEGGNLDNLPAYQLCRGYLEPEYADYLESIDDPTLIKELAALARTRHASPLAVFELFRDALQEAQESGEVWFFSIVSRTYDTLADNFGSNAIKCIGSPVSFNDERINQGITLVPALVQTDLFIDEIRRSIELSDNVREQKQLRRSFMFFTEGLPANALSDESNELREYITESLLRERK